MTNGPDGSTLRHRRHDCRPGGSSAPSATDSGSSGGSTDCPAGAGKYIYVVSDQNELYTFDRSTGWSRPRPPRGTSLLHGPRPAQLSGRAHTPDNGGVNFRWPWIDRPSLWVNLFNDGKIFKVDTTQASLPCTDTELCAGPGWLLRRNWAWDSSTVSARRTPHGAPLRLRQHRPRRATALRGAAKGSA